MKDAILPIIFGVLVAVASSVAIRTGEWGIGTRGLTLVSFKRTERPIMFWSGICTAFAVSAYFLLLGIGLI